MNARGREVGTCAASRPAPILAILPTWCQVLTFCRDSSPRSR